MGKKFELGLGVGVQTWLCKISYKNEKGYYLYKYIELAYSQLKFEIVGVMSTVTEFQFKLCLVCILICNFLFGTFYCYWIGAIVKFTMSFSLSHSGNI